MTIRTLRQHGFDIKAFNNRLDYHMAKANVNAAQLSKRAGLNPRAVRDIKEGRIESPRVKTVLALEAALDLTPGTLLGFGPGAILEELQVLISGLDEAAQRKLLEMIMTLR